jgi:dipeptide transport system permease protein
MILIAVFANVLARIPGSVPRCAAGSAAWQEGGTWRICLVLMMWADMLSRLMYGARLSLLVGCLVVVLSC